MRNAIRATRSLLNTRNFITFGTLFVLSAGGCTDDTQHAGGGIWGVPATQPTGDAASPPAGSGPSGPAPIADEANAGSPAGGVGGVGGSGGSGSSGTEECGNGIVCATQDMNPGPDATDLVGAIPAPPGGLPSEASIDISGFEVPDQGTCGSCVAFATRSSMGIRAVSDLAAFTAFSPAHVWYNAGYGADDCDFGSSISVVVGGNSRPTAPVVGEESWPYDPLSPEDSLMMVPSAMFLEDMGIAYIGGSTTVTPGSVDELKAAIVYGWPVILAVTVHSNEGWNRTGVVELPSTSDKIRGLHAITVYGYDDSVERFFFENSWSERWGMRGGGTLSYAFVESPYSHGGYAIEEIIPKMQCTPSCAGRLCGPDGCGGTCAPGCDAGYTCTDAGACVFDCPAGAFLCPSAGTFCKDGNSVAQCTGPDSHGCYNTVVTSCDDGNACTADSCASGACRHATGGAEVCDGRDNDCNGLIDDGTLCASGSECVSGSCRPKCGNGTCNAGETCSSCPADCGCASGRFCKSGACVEVWVDLCTDINYSPGGDDCDSSKSGNQCLRIPVNTSGLLNIQNLGSYCSYNDQVSSVVVHNASSVTLYKDNTYQGCSVTLTSSCSDLHDRNGITCGRYANCSGNIGDQATSVRVVP